MTKTINLSDNLKQLSEIASWFDDQQSIDVEVGLSKVKLAAGLIKESKQRLKEIENEFIEIKNEIDEDEHLEEGHKVNTLYTLPNDKTGDESSTNKPPF